MTKNIDKTLKLSKKRDKTVYNIEKTSKISKNRDKIV